MTDISRLAAFLLLALAACAKPPPEPSAGTRDTAAPISSIAVVDQARLDGDWLEVGGAPRGCAPARLAISGAGTRIQGQGCYLPVADGAVLTSAGPGRYLTGSAPGPLWLLWVDFDYRTLVIGTPSGSFATVLNRGGPIPEDRLTAAKRILAFNGYDISKLEF